MNTADAFSDIYSENQYKNAELNDLKNLLVDRKEASVTLRMRRLVAEKSGIKKKSHNLHPNCRKDSLRASQKLARPRSLQAQKSKAVKLSFEKRAPGPLLKKGCLGN